MSINFDVVMDTPEYSVDMKTGLDTLQGASDATRCISETILSGKVPKRKTHRDSVRTSLKQSFKGSYGHVYSVDIFDVRYEEKFNEIGESAFSELISYFLNESLYMDSSLLSEKAQCVVDDLGEVAEDLAKELRVSVMGRIHAVSTRFNHDVKIRFRKGINDKTILASFNQSTAEVLKSKVSGEVLLIMASITRLNIYTGNGRLQLKESKGTVAFGFSGSYSSVIFSLKKVLSKNLNNNNGLYEDDCKFLNLTVLPVILRDGTVVKYIIKGIFDDQ